MFPFYITTSKLAAQTQLDWMYRACSFSRGKEGGRKQVRERNKWDKERMWDKYNNI